MSLVITVIVVEDDSTTPIEQWKEATCSINGEKIPEEYTYDIDATDATIETEVEADLSAKGYTWCG